MSGALTSLERHIWQALSSHENLVLSLAPLSLPGTPLSSTTLDLVTTRIREVCGSETIARSVRFLPGPDLEDDDDGDPNEQRRWGIAQRYGYDDFEELLSDIFLDSSDGNRSMVEIVNTRRDSRDNDGDDGDDVASSSGSRRTASPEMHCDVPQTLVLPFVETYAPSVQIQIQNMIRDKRFSLKGRSYLLPDEFVAIALVDSMCDKGLRGDLIDRFGLALSLTEADIHTTRPPSLPTLQNAATPALHSKLDIRTYASDLITSTRHHPLLHNVLMTGRCSALHVMRMASYAVLLSNASDPATLEQKEIRPDDLRSIYSSCVVHRLRLREDHQKLSNFWEAGPLSATEQQAQSIPGVNVPGGGKKSKAPATTKPLNPATSSPGEEERLVAQVLLAILDTV